MKTINLFGRKYQRTYNLFSSFQLSVNNFKYVEDTSQFMKDYIENYNENRDKGYFLEADIQYHETLQWFTLFAWKNENWKSWKTCMIKKNMLYKLKMSIRSWITFEQFRRVVKFNRKAWLNSYIDKKTEPIKNVKNDFEKNFSELINKVVFRKTMENVWKYRDIQLVTTEARRNYLKLEPNYYTIIFFLQVNKTNKIVMCESG